MNFFQHQVAARRSSRIMVFLFILAVVAVVVSVDFVLGLVYRLSTNEVAPASLYVLGAAATAALILLVSLFNVARLSQGGIAVARMVGARRVSPDTADAAERRLRNVVEEMSIASGVRVPEIFVMDEERGINAFAAGWNVSSAVVAVTRGALDTLTRDELQGVIAHEFSHILNGDMRLNVRMLAVLAGIVFLASVGEFLMRSVRGSRDTKGLVLVGLALFLIGYVGLFFARLIKSSVARQREFLADASSVQFTRNPDGIAGALDQIRASATGTLIANRYAEEMSHMYFGAAVKVRLGGLFDTHPPLEERIRRVHPRFERATYQAQREVPQEQRGRRASDLAAAWGRTLEESVALVGSVDPQKVEFAARVTAAIPEAVLKDLASAQTGGGVLIALILAEPEPARELQLRNVAPALAARARELSRLLRGLGAQFHLPLIDLALPALKSQSEAAKKELLAALETVVNADRRVSLHELVVLALVGDQLLPPPKVAETRRLSEVLPQAATVLSFMVHAGTRIDATGSREAGLQAALQAGAGVLGIRSAVIAPGLNLYAINAALEALRALAPMEKAVLVKALFAAVTYDGTIRVAEAELMRLVGAVLDCPLPPLFDTLLAESL
jgi:Zn-dependent protease with chaperone function